MDSNIINGSLTDKSSPQTYKILLSGGENRSEEKNTVAAAGNLTHEKMADLTKNEQWVRRALSYFDSIDRDQDEIVTIDQIVMFAEGMRVWCNASDSEINGLKERLRETYTDVGFTSDGMQRKDFPKNLNGFASRERERKKNGEVTLHSKLINAHFDVIDLDKNGVISLDEMKIRMKAIGMPEESAAPYLVMADKNKDGVIQRDELNEIEFRFWFEEIDKSIDNLYGGCYSGNL